MLTIILIILLYYIQLFLLHVRLQFVLISELIDCNQS